MALAGCHIFAKQFGLDELNVLMEHFRPALERMGCDPALARRQWIQVNGHIGNQYLHGADRSTQHIPGINTLPNKSDSPIS